MFNLMFTMEDLEMMDPDLEAEEEDKRDIAAAEAMDCDAIFQIRYAAKMSEEGKLAIAEWLRHQANTLLSDGHEYAACFTARYNPTPGSEISQ